MAWPLGFLLLYVRKVRLQLTPFPGWVICFFLGGGGVYPTLAGSAGLTAMAMIPLIAVSAVVQMAMMTGGYGDNEASSRRRNLGRSVRRGSLCNRPCTVENLRGRVQKLVE